MPNEPDSGDGSSPAEMGSVTYHYIKSRFFRVVHADGAYGGLTAQGNIHVAMYNERRAIPRTVIREIEGDELGPEKIVDARAGVVRELEVDVVMGISTARSLHQWLGDKIESWEKMFGEAGMSGQPKDD